LTDLESVPKISIITVNKNGGKFLRETLNSVRDQEFKDYEHIVIDGASTDNSLEILKEYRGVRWISEPDKSPNEAFRKGFRMAKGKYIMVMCVSDKYLSNTWFTRCVEALESDRSISLVWGLSVNMNELGDITSIWSPWWFDSMPPQKTSFFNFWIATAAYLPELNYCVRRNVYLNCFPNEVEGDLMSSYNPFLLMVFNFMKRGYQPYFLRIIAHCGRVHDGQITQKMHSLEVRTRKIYKCLVRNYFLGVLFGTEKHYFRDGNQNVVEILSARQRITLPFLVFYYKVALILLKTTNLGRIKSAIANKIKVYSSRFSG
jgi:glycosyltransferase involved in cell wall biosynthesis